MVHRKTSILLLGLLITLLATSLSSAEGCCIEEQDGSTSSYQALCVEEGQVSTYGYTADEENCTTNGFTWETQSCDTILECDVGCCCGENGGHWLTTERSCIGDDTFVSGANDCEAACDQGKEHYSISGTVYDEEGAPKGGINVTLDTPSNRQLTKDDGTFSFGGVTSDSHILYANNETCSGKKFFYPSSDKEGLNITLECTGAAPPEQGCVPQWDCGYDDDTTCGRRYDNCFDKAGCTELDYTEYTGRPLPFNPCPLLSTTCENDGKIDEGEQCDTYQGTIRFADGVSSTCGDYGDYAGEAQEVGCTDCHVDTSSCETCPGPDPAYCTQAQCRECDTCKESPRCQEYDCLSVTPKLTTEGITYTEGDDSVLITWEFPQDCAAQVQAFAVERCEGEGCAEEDVTHSTRLDRHTNPELFQASSGVYDHEEAGLRPDTLYCYRISATIKEGEETATTDSGAFACKRSGDEECMRDHPEQMCKENQVVTCQADNTVQPEDSCEEGLTCIASAETGTASCADTIACDQCNGPMGMYGYLASTNPFLISFYDLEADQTDTIACDEKRIINPYQPVGDHLPLCYEEKTLTTSQGLDSCDAIKSCYDYKNQGACEEDHCRVFGDQACAWNDFAGFGAQAGLGVCVPASEEEEQECDRCGEDKAVLPACTKELCTSYGTQPQSCLFSKTTTYGGACLSRAQATCDDYTSQEDCEGGRPSTIDAQYSDNRRVAGTNKHTPSLDHFRLGTCQWVDDKCIKNADNHTPYNTPTTDCTNNDREAQPSCDHDFAPPTTTLQLISPQEQGLGPYPVYSAKELFTYQAEDDHSTRAEISTWFGRAAITDGEENNTYPDQEYDDFKALLANSHDGTHNITYYSQDRSKNLEEVKHAIIILDRTPPLNATYEEQQTWYRIAEDEYRTNLTITHSYEDPHGPLSCNTTLVGSAPVSYGGDRDYVYVQSGAELTNHYYGLADDTYTFRANCSDHPSLGNRRAYDHEVRIEADKSINESQPSGSVYSAPAGDITINLSIRTLKPVSECKYAPAEETDKPLQYRGAWAFTIDNQGRRHNDTLVLGEEGIYRYHVGCNFTDGNVTQGNRADMIAFSIDNTAPRTRAVYATTGEDYRGAVEHFEEQALIRFERTDDDEDLLLRTQDDSVWYNGTAGIKATYYCLDSNERAGSCEPFIEWQGETLIFNETNINGKDVLHYYSEDRAGNQEQEQFQTIYVRDLDVDITGVEVCTKDGTACYRQTRPVSD